jgi:serine/threonine protein kinase
MFMQQLLSAVTCLRGRSIVHRDIKTQNLPHGHAPKNEQVDNFMGCVSDVTSNFLDPRNAGVGRQLPLNQIVFV